MVSNTNGTSGDCGQVALRLRIAQSMNETIVRVCGESKAESKPVQYFAESARMWRAIAHAAQLDGDFEAMRQSHFRALENEAVVRGAGFEPTTK